jgi:5-methylcytosine-specific restriction protein A
MARLQSLKPRVQALNTNRVISLPARPEAIERKRGGAGVKDRQRIRERDQYLCQECKRNGRVSVGRVVDHKIPLWAGGTDDDWNKELLCNPCHDAKTAKEAAERAKTR